MPANSSEQISFTEVSFLTFQAVVEVILVCLAGFWAAKTNLLDKKAQKHVSILNVDIFTPALIFSKLAPSLSLKKLFEIFIIPIFYAISTGISFLVSRIVSRYLQLDEYESNFVTAMSVFGNSNSLPVSLTIALAYTLPNLEWDDVPNDNPDQVASRGILYLLIFQQIGQVLRWSWGYNTLLKRKPSSYLATDGYGTDTSSKSGNSHLVPNTDYSSSTVSRSSTQQLLRGPDHLEDQIEDFELSNEPNLLKKCAIRAKYWAHKFLSAMNPPLYAMAASVFVASIPPLQRAFYVDNGFVQNTISKAITQLGSVSIPLILIILGSNLYPSAETPPKSDNYNKIVIGSLVSRMIIPPLILLPLIALAVKVSDTSILDDPIFLVVAFILTISPPAIQLSQICQLNELFEKEMAGVLFWGYVVLTLPTTIAIVSAALSVLQWAMD